VEKEKEKGLRRGAKGWEERKEECGRYFLEVIEKGRRWEKEVWEK